MSITPLIRRIHMDDNPAVATLIRTVMTEFHLDGPGTSLHDDEVQSMAEHYGHDRAAYFVLVLGDDIIGGGGIGPLVGADASVCELKKMYFLPEARGKGYGKRMLQMCLDAARDLGYTTCYLETVASMTTARAMYAKHGFGALGAPMGNTCHTVCDQWMSLEL